MMACVSFVIHMFVPAPWSVYVMSVTMVPIKAGVPFVGDLVFQTLTIAKSAPFVKRMYVFIHLLHLIIIIQGVL